MGHDENTRTLSPTSRLDYYGIDWVYSGENCAVVVLLVIQKNTLLIVYSNYGENHQHTMTYWSTQT